MKLLSLLGVTRLASPRNNCFSNRLFEECPLVCDGLAPQYGLVCATHEVAAAQQISPTTEIQMEEQTTRQCGRDL